MSELRRTVLAATATVLAGCGLAPSPSSTDSPPETPPNAFFAFTWDPDGSAYEVEFTGGNRLTRENTGGVAVMVGTADLDEAVRWVGSTADEDGRDDGDDGEYPPRTPFPLTPGATLRVPVAAPGTVRVVWVAPEGRGSRLLDRWRLVDQPTTGEP